MSATGSAPVATEPGGPASANGAVYDLEHVADSARTALDAQAVLLEARSSGSDARLVFTGLDPADADRIQAALAASRNGNGALLVRELESHPRTAGAFSWSSHGFESLVSVPLIWEGKEVGALHALGPSWRRSDREQRERALAVASHAALAVTFGHLRRKTARISQELEDAVTLDEIALEARSLERFGDELVRRLTVLGVETGGVMVLDSERDVLQLLPGGFGAGPDATASYRVRVDNPISNSARVFSTSEPYLSNEAQGDAGVMQDYVDLFHVERLLSVPLGREGKSVGVLHLANKPTQFKATDVYRAQAFAARLGPVVELGMTMIALRRQRRATEVLVDLALGIASGNEIFQLVRTAFERFGDVIGTDLLMLVPPGGAAMVWRRHQLPPGVQDGLEEEARSRSSMRPGLTEPRGAGDPGHAKLFVPVRLAGKHIATIATLRQRAEAFVATERELLGRLASLAAVGWATENYQRQRAEVALLRDRKRIADDLHDTVAQILFGAQMDLDRVLEGSELPGPATSAVLHARSLLLRGDAEIRQVIHQLSRPVRGGLAQRLGLLAEALEEELGTSVRVEVPPGVGEAAKSLRRSVTDALVKVAQEAITNAAKHAGPCSIRVKLGISRRERLVLTVTDDGIGRDSHPDQNGGYGLASVRSAMRECGGLLQVKSQADGGTRVLASVPL